MEDGVFVSGVTPSWGILQGYYMSRLSIQIQTAEAAFYLVDILDTSVAFLVIFGFSAVLNFAVRYKPQLHSLI